jgi:tetratricopeptide (TPR) repeat protein
MTRGHRSPLGLRRFVVGALLAIVLGAVVAPGAAQAQPQGQPAGPEVSPGEAFFTEGAALYGRREYAAAMPLLVQAVQADPDEPRFYRGLARAAHYAESYDLATIYYDIYLTNYAEHARAERSRDNREEAIRNERQRANSHRTSPETPPALPQTQAAALAALEERLRTGPYMAEGAAGAWAVYQALLRAGYAAPRLIELRAQLAAGLLGETEALFEPQSNAPVAVVPSDVWRSVPQRFAAIAELGQTQLDPTFVAAREAAARGQVLLINETHELAANEFRAATDADPQLIMAYWGLILSYHGQSMNQGRPMNPHATVLVDRLEELTRAQAPQHVPLVSVARSIVWYDMARYEEAAASLMNLLAPGYVPAASRPEMRLPR